MTLKKSLPSSQPPVTGGVDSPELLPFHPSANVFDLLEGEAFDELVADIERRGLRIPIVTHKGQIIDGRNRARACVKAGVTPRYQDYDGPDDEEAIRRYIISCNIHRRHLKPEERRKHLKQLLEWHPEKSDRAIAAETGFSHTHVQKTRKRTGNKLPVGGRRTGKDGISRRMPTQAKKPKTAAVDGAPPSVAPLTSQAMPPKTNGAAVPALPPPAEAAQHDVDPQAKFERDNFTRDQARLEYLESEVHRLVTVNGALEATADDLRKDLTALQAKLAIPTSQAMPGDIGPLLPADVKEPIALHIAIEALVYWGKHTVSFENLPEDVVFSRGDLDEVISKLRRMNESKSMVARRKALASQQKAKAKAKAA